MKQIIVMTIAAAMFVLANPIKAQSSAYSSCMDKCERMKSRCEGSTAEVVGRAGKCITDNLARQNARMQLYQAEARRGVIRPDLLRDDGPNCGQQYADNQEACGDQYESCTDRCDKLQ